MRISYECEDLIQELKEDIEEFGEKEIFVAWLENINDTDIITNYDFLAKDLKQEELESNERFILIEAGLLLKRLIEQNEII